MPLRRARGMYASELWRVMPWPGAGDHAPRSAQRHGVLLPMVAKRCCTDRTRLIQVTTKAASTVP